MLIKNLLKNVVIIIFIILTPLLSWSAPAQNCLHLLTSQKGIFEGKVGANDEYNFKIDLSESKVTLSDQNGNKSSFQANVQRHQPDVENGNFVTLSLILPDTYYNTQFRIFKFLFKETSDGNMELVSASERNRAFTRGNLITTSETYSQHKNLVTFDLDGELIDANPESGDLIINGNGRRSSILQAHKEFHAVNNIDEKGKRFLTLSAVVPDPYYNTELMIYEVLFEVTADGKMKFRSATKKYFIYPPFSLVKNKEVRRPLSRITEIELKDNRTKLEVNPYKEQINIYDFKGNKSEYKLHKLTHFPDAENGKEFVTFSVILADPYYNTEITVFEIVYERLDSGLYKFVRANKKSIGI